MLRVLRVLWILPVSVATLCLAGCYSYVPLQGTPAGVGRGTAMKIHFSRPIDIRMGDLGANNVVEVDAEMVRDEGDSLAVSVFQTTSQSGYEQQVSGRTAKIPTDAIVGIESRKFSALKTLLAGGLVVAVAIGAAAALSSSGGGSPINKPPPAGQ